MAETKRIEYVLGVLDRFTAPLRAFNDRVDGLVRPVKRVQHSLAAIRRESGFDRVATQVGLVQTRLGGVLSLAGRVSGALAGAAGGVAFALHRTSEEMNRLRSQAESVGMGSSALMSYGAAVRDLGFNFENVVDLVEEMNNKIGESKGLEQTTPVKEAMQMLKLDFAEIARMKPEEQFERIMAAAASMGDQQMASSAMDILMGGEANKITGHLREVAKQRGMSVQELLEHYKQLNMLTDEGTERFRRFGHAGGDLFTVLGSGFQELMSFLADRLEPLLERVTAWMVDNFDDIKNRVSTMLDGFDPQEFLEGARRIWTALKRIWSVVSWLVEKLGGWGNVLTGLAVILGVKMVVAVVSLAVAFGGLGVAALTSLGAITAAVFALGKAVMLNPIGLVLTGLALLAGVIIAKWEPIKDFFKGVASKVLSAMESLAQKIKDAFVAPFDWLAEKFSWVVGVAQRVGGLLGLGADSPRQADEGRGASGEWGRAAQRLGQINEQRSVSETTTRQESRVSVDFRNLPRGTRVRSEGRAPLDLSMGYAMSSPA